MRHAVLIGAICAVGITACSEETGPNISGIDPLAIVRVSVSPSLDTLFVADTLRPTDRRQMSADVITRTGNPVAGAKVVWSSSNPEVAVVTETGLVIPTGYGTTTISASATQIGKATIVVMPAARTVLVTPGMDTIFVEDPIALRDSIRLVAKAFDEEGKQITGVAFTWNSAATNIATVNGSGSVLARALGVVTVTATSGEHVGSASVRVASAVKSIRVSAPVTTVLALDTLQLTATALGYDDKPMAGRTFSWTSSNPAVATVDNNGRAIFLSAGVTTFTAKSAFTTNTLVVGALERQFLSIDAGDDVTCGYTNLGRGYCWGSGTFDRLASAADSSCFGDGGTSPCTLAPKRFAGPALEFTTLAVDSTSGCGVTTSKQLYCWGADGAGQIGNGSRGGGAEPSLATVAQVRFDSVTVGGAHACALSTTREAYCWGADGRGQLGDNRTINSTTPIPVAGGLTFSSISAGREHTCGIAGGKAYCWGNNDFGQLGAGTAGTDSHVPIAVATAENFSAVTAGEAHTCGLTTGGSAVCWGRGDLGQTGAAALTSGATPIVVGGGPFSQLSAGSAHTCAINASGTAFCWGNGSWGQTGGAGSVTAAAVSGGIAFKSITAGTRHTCGIATDGETYCWGSNVFGTLGNELQAAFRTTPQKVAVPR
jgi:alpha-tubulin suppressor-like RCC1 family protein